MFKHRVLLTSVSGAFGPQNIRFMKDSIKGDVWVLGVDVKHSYVSEKYADKFVIVPKGNSDNYISAILDLINIHNISLVLPCSDEEAINLSKSRDIIKKNNTILATAKTSTINTISNKISTYRFLENEGITVPLFEVCKDKNELIKYASKFYEKEGSFVIKDPIARGNRGIFLVDKIISGKQDYMGSREVHIGWEYFTKNFNKLIDNLYPKLITERLYNPCYDIDVLARNGQLIHAISRERINPAGVPYYGNIMRINNKLYSMAKKVAEVLNLTWLYDIDVMTRKDGTPVLLEVNPRPSGSSVASMECGVPLYKDLLELKNKEIFDENNYFEDGTIISPSLICEITKPKLN